MTEDEWREADLVTVGRAECTEPATPEAVARCDREDYLEAYCVGVNDYRKRIAGE